MTNESIKLAFQRFWEHVVSIVNDKADINELSVHTSDVGNPHNVTAEQVGADPKGSAATALSDAQDYANQISENTLELANEYADNLVSGIPEPAFLVVVSGNDIDGYSANKAFTEIKEAYDNNIVVIAQYGDAVCPMSELSASNAVFGSLSETVFNIVITSDNTVSISAETPLTMERNYEMSTDNKSIIGAIEELYLNKVTNDEVINKVNANSKDTGYSPAEDSDVATKIYVDDTRKAPFTELILIDEVNNFEYVVKMNNGQLISYCKNVTEIQVVEPPTKTSYIEGDAVDFTGLGVYTVREDGSLIPVDDYEVTGYQETIAVDDTKVEFTVSYTNPEDEAVYTASGSFDITVMPYLDFILQDFYYEDNGDGTYTLVGWKGTLDGVPSDKLEIKPDNRLKL